MYGYPSFNMVFKPPIIKDNSYKMITVFKGEKKQVRVDRSHGYITGNVIIHAIAYLKLNKY